MDFKGKVVLITGASTGIGYATAVHFANLGASLSLTGRNEANLKNTAGKCKAASGVDPLCVTGDLAKEDDVAAIFRETVGRYGRLDVLVNNAGVLVPGNLEESTSEVYDSTFDTNVKAIVHLTRLALPYLIESKGNVVNVSSIGSCRTGLPIIYSMSKAALDQFTRCLAHELGGRHVRVNSVNPGATMTEMLKRFVTVDDEVNEAALETVKSHHALSRVGNPEEVAATIAFLASDLAANITGVILPVDGGYNVMPPS